MRSYEPSKYCFNDKLKKNGYRWIPTYIGFVAMCFDVISKGVSSLSC